MITKSPTRLFFIVASLIILLSVVFFHPFFKARYNQKYRHALFTEFSQSLESDGFDAETYWFFRERFSPGTFLREEATTDFFSTFRIVTTTDPITPLFVYESEFLRSVEGIATKDSNTQLEDIPQQFPGEVVSRSDEYILQKLSDTLYVFAFVVPTETMQEVNGMFDYVASERELLEDRVWYNATYIYL